VNSSPRPCAAKLLLMNRSNDGNRSAIAASYVDRLPSFSGVQRPSTSCSSSASVVRFGPSRLSFDENVPRPSTEYSRPIERVAAGGVVDRVGAVA
jgi:hypothetical protein